MADMFDHTVLCKNCETKMKKGFAIKNGFKIRMLYCDKCNDKILHPHDLEEYNGFKNLRNKEFRVKLRLVGNSYAVSIPKEIIHFIEEQEKMMDNFVKLCFEDFNKLSLMFDTEDRNKKDKLKTDLK